ncbi:MAG TPA: methyltransferase domain-containing protein [Pseudomonadales bacterium]
MVRNHFYLETCAGPGRCVQDEGETSSFRADLHELPLSNNALDAVVLHHVLEGAQDPRTAIREISRVLAPGGRLLIVSFNPWSLWGIRGAYARFFRDSFSGLRFVSPRRLQDWLTVLGFELQQEVKFLAYELPFQTRNKDAGAWQRLRGLCNRLGLPIGGVYLISAVKQAAAIRPDWSLRAVQGRKLTPAAYPKLSARIARLPVRPEQPERIEGPG